MLKVVAIVVLGALVLGFVTNTIVSAREASRYKAPGSFVTVDGRRVRYQCSGSGSPTVVFESGFGGTSLDWSLVQPEIAMHNRTCSYDRAGYGWSDPPRKHSLVTIRDDFDAVLTAAHVDGPIVLVAHSFGGLLAVDYASRHPHRVAGLVFVDAATKPTYETMNGAIPAFYANGKKLAVVTRVGSVLTRFGLTRLANQPIAPKTTAPKVRAEYRARGWLPSAYNAYAADLDATKSYVEGAEDAPPTHVPAVVLTHETPGTMWTGLPAAKAEALWQDQQRKLAARFDASHEIVPGTGHFIEVLRPRAVIDAIEDVLVRLPAG